MSKMGVLSRLLVVGLVTALLFASPAAADETGDAGSGSGGSACGDGSSGNCTSGSSPAGNSTEPAPSNATGSSPPPEGSSAIEPSQSLISGGPGGTTCDVIRPTGSKPYLSVNPVLGVLTVNLGCITRHVRGLVDSGTTQLP